MPVVRGSQAFPGAVIVVQMADPDRAGLRRRSGQPLLRTDGRRPRAGRTAAFRVAASRRRGPGPSRPRRAGRSRPRELGDRPRRGRSPPREPAPWRLRPGRAAGALFRAGPAEGGQRPHRPVAASPYELRRHHRRRLQAATGQRPGAGATAPGPGGAVRGDERLRHPQLGRAWARCCPS